MRICIASDHAGFKLKADLLDFLVTEGHNVSDKGPYEIKEGDDYPDYCMPVAAAVAADAALMGIVIGFSGQGEAIAANRVVGARAAVYYGGPEEILRLSREHNNANILSLGAHFLTAREAREAVRLWLSVPFSNEERHIRRIKKLDHEI